MGWLEVGVIYENNAWSIGVAEVFIEEAKLNGITIVNLEDSFITEGLHNSNGEFWHRQVDI